MLRRLFRLFFGISCFCVLLSARDANAVPRPLWTVPPLSSFDGAHWGDLTLGSTTFRQIQASYETGKGAYEHSTRLTLAKDTPLRVDLGWYKIGDEEILSFIAVRFNDAGPHLDDVLQLFDPKDERVEDYFWRGRSEDWRVYRDPLKGVAVFSLRDEEAMAPLVILTTPAALSGIGTKLQHEYCPIEPRIDPHANDPKVMEFGNIDIKLDDDLDLADKEKWRTRNRIVDAYADGTLRYRRSGAGSYNVSMTGSKKHDGGSVQVSVSISGDGPYGPLSASGGGSETWKWKKKDGDHHDEQDCVVDSYREALSDAMKEAESSFAQSMEKSGPVPLWQIREDQWTEVVDAIRATSRSDALAPTVLR